MEWISFAFANVWHVECADCSFEENYFLSQVSFSLPVFISVPELVVCEQAFVCNTFLFTFDLFWLGIRFVPGLGHKSFGLVFGWHDQRYYAGSEGVILAEALHNGW